MRRVAAGHRLAYRLCMAAVKKAVPRQKKRKTTAADVTVGNRTLEAVLLDLAERSARAEERSARAEEQIAKVQIDLADMGYKMTAALNTIAAMSSDLRRMFDHMQAFNAGTDARLTALESRAGS